MLRVDEIEDAILDTLRRDERLGAYVRTFAPAPSLQAKDLESLAVLHPAIGVISETGTYACVLGGVQDEVGTFLVICINRNLRSATGALRGGAPPEIGVWGMVEDCRRALLATPGLGLGDGVDCLPVRRALLRVEAPWAFATLEVEARWRNL